MLACANAWTPSMWCSIVEPCEMAQVTKPRQRGGLRRPVPVTSEHFSPDLNAALTVVSGSSRRASTRASTPSTHATDTPARLRRRPCEIASALPLPRASPTAEPFFGFHRIRCPATSCGSMGLTGLHTRSPRIQRGESGMEKNTHTHTNT